MSALSGADYCLNGGDEGRRRRWPSAGGGGGPRRRPHALGDSWRSCTSAWNSCAVKPMTLPRSFGTSGRHSTSPRRSWTRWRAGPDLLYRLKKKYGATVEEMLAYLDKCRRELDDMETADDTLARLEQQLEKARKAVLAAGAELTARPERGRRAFWSSASSPSCGTWTCTRSGSPSTSGRRSLGPDGCDAVRFLMSANAGEDSEAHRPRSPPAVSWPGSCWP